VATGKPSVTKGTHPEASLKKNAFFS